MEPLFVCSFEMTRELYLFLCDHPLGKAAKRRLLCWRLLHISFLVLMLAGAFSSLLGRDWLFAFLFLVLAAAFAYKLLYQRRVINKKQYRLLRESQTGQGWLRTISFADGVTVQDNNTQTVFSYTDFVRYTEDAAACYLWRDENLLLRLPKDGFTIGTPTDFARFIRQKLS